MVFDPAAGKVAALVELGDRSHDAEEDRKRDAMTSGAGYQTIRIAGSLKPTLQTALRATEVLRAMRPVGAMD